METIHKEKLLLGFILSSLAQLAMMFVMYFVRFRQFSIIRFFLIPMLLMQALAICLLMFRIRKYHYSTHILFSSRQLFEGKINNARPFVSHGYVRDTSTTILYCRRIHKVGRQTRPNTLLSQSWCNSRLDHTHFNTIHAILRSSCVLQEIFTRTFTQVYKLGKTRHPFQP